MEHNHNHPHGHNHDNHNHDSHHEHKQNEASAAVTPEAAETFVETLTEKDISPKTTIWLGDLAHRLTHSITTGELLLFIAAVALIPLFLYEMMTPEVLGKSAIGITALLPVIFFAIAIYFNKDGARPIGIFFHSATAVGLIMGAVALIPMLGAVSPALMGYDGVVIMPLLALLFLFLAARFPNTGASYILGATAAIVLFFYSSAALVTQPCISELYGGNPNASAYCQVTPLLANIFLPLAFYIIGYFAYTRRSA